MIRVVLVCVWFAALPMAANGQQQAPSAVSAPAAAARESVSDIASADVDSPSITENRSLTNDLLVDALVVRAQDRLQARQDYYWGIAAAAGAIVVALLTFFGFGQIADIRKNIRDGVLQDLRNEIENNESFRENVASRIQSGLMRELGGQEARLRQDMAFVRVQVLTERANRGEDLDSNDVDGIKEGLFSIVDRPDIVQTASFAALLQPALVVFFQRGLSREIDQIDDRLGDIITSSRANWRQQSSLLQHYGLRVIGRMDEVDVREPTLGRFLRYVNSLKRWDYYELAVHYLMAMEFDLRRPGWEKRIADAWNDIQHMSESEQAELHGNILYCSDVNRLSPSPKQVHYRMARIFGDLTNQYAKNFEAPRRAFESQQTKSKARDAAE